ncbi:actin [Diplonema papillatum]|nr:actin [Diplonema papillatum]
MASRVDMRIVEGSSLHNVQKIGKSSPYVVVECGGSVVGKTVEVKKDLNPKWKDAKISFPVQDALAAKARFEVKSGSKMMGEGHLSLKSVTADVGYGEICEKKIELTTSSKKPGGTLVVRVRVNDPNAEPAASPSPERRANSVAQSAPGTPRSGANTPRSSQSVDPALRKRVVRFYKAHAPDKISGVDEMLQNNTRSDDALFEALVQKYGEEPESSDESDETSSENESDGRAEEDPRENDPEEEIVEEEETPADWIPPREPEPSPEDEEAFSNSPASDVGAAPFSAPVDYLAVVTRYYKLHDPAKLAAAPLLVKRHEANPEQLLQLLRNKWGELPDDDATESVPQTPLRDVDKAWSEGPDTVIRRVSQSSQLSESRNSDPMEAEMVKQRHQLAELVKKTEELKKENEGLLEIIDAERGVKESLESKTKRLQRELDEKDAELEDARTRVAHIEKHAGDSAHASDEIEQLNGQVARLKTNLSEVTAANDKLESDAAILQQTVADLRSESAASQWEATEAADAAKNDLEARLAAATEEAAALKTDFASKLAEAAATEAGLRAQLLEAAPPRDADESQVRLQAAAAAQREAEAAAKAAADTVEQLANDLTALRAQLDEAETSHKAEIAALQAQLDDAEASHKAEIATLQHDEADTGHNAEITSLQAQLDEVETSHKAEIAALQHDEAGHNAEVAALQAQLDEVETKHNAEIAALQTQLDDAETSHKAEIDALQAQLDEAKTSHQAEVAALQAQRDKAETGSKAELAAQKSALENTAAEQQKAHAEATSRQAASAGDSKAEQDRLSAKGKELADLESRLATLKDELDRRERELAAEGSAAAERRASLEAGEARAAAKASALADKEAELAALETRLHAQKGELESLAFKHRGEAAIAPDLEARIKKLEDDEKRVKATQKQVLEQTKRLHGEVRKKSEEAAAKMRHADQKTEESIKMEESANERLIAVACKEEELRIRELEVEKNELNKPEAASPEPCGADTGGPDSLRAERDAALEKLAQLEVSYNLLVKDGDKSGGSSPAKPRQLGAKTTIPGTPAKDKAALVNMRMERDAMKAERDSAIQRCNNLLAAQRSAELSSGKGRKQTGASSPSPGKALDKERASLDTRRQDVARAEAAAAEKLRLLKEKQQEITAREQALAEREINLELSTGPHAMAEEAIRLAALERHLKKREEEVEEKLSKSHEVNGLTPSDDQPSAKAMANEAIRLAALERNLGKREEDLENLAKSLPSPQRSVSEAPTVPGDPHDDASVVLALREQLKAKDDELDALAQGLDGKPDGNANGPSAAALAEQAAQLAAFEQQLQKREEELNERQTTTERGIELAQWEERLQRREDSLNAFEAEPPDKNAQADAEESESAAIQRDEAEAAFALLSKQQEELDRKQAAYDERVQDLEQKTRELEQRIRDVHKAELQVSQGMQQQETEILDIATLQVTVGDREKQVSLDEQALEERKRKVARSEEEVKEFVHALAEKEANLLKREEQWKKALKDVEERQHTIRDVELRQEELRQQSGELKTFLAEVRARQRSLSAEEARAEERRRALDELQAQLRAKEAKLRELQAQVQSRPGRETAMTAREGNIARREDACRRRERELQSFLSVKESELQKSASQIRTERASFERMRSTTPRSASNQRSSLTGRHSEHRCVSPSSHAALPVRSSSTNSQGSGLLAQTTVSPPSYGNIYTNGINSTHPGKAVSLENAVQSLTVTLDTYEEMLRD